jgi:hypothetical protein
MIRLIFALLVLIAPAAAWAKDCGAGSIDARQIGTDDYDPNDLAQSVVRVSLRLAEDCDLRDLRVVPRDSTVFQLTSGGVTLQSIQSDDPQITVRNISEFELKQRVAMQLKRGEEVIFDLLDLAPGQYVRSGTYQATIDFVDANRPLGTLLLNVIVSPTVRLFGAAETGNIDLDLGRLNDGVSAQQSIYFRSNAQVSLLVTSDNGGKLVHERGTQFGSIAYQAQLNGASINTVNPAVVPLGGFSGQLTEVRFGVEIAPIRAAFAGIYRDVITISFTAL